MYRTDALAGSLRALKNCKNGVIDNNIKNSRQPKNCRGYLLNGNMPIIVPFTVPAFQASTPSHKIKVDLGVTMQNANYKLSIENQSVKVQYSSYKWLDYTIDTKTVSSVTIGFYNEQSKAIAKTDWALIIFPS